MPANGSAEWPPDDRLRRASSIPCRQRYDRLGVLDHPPSRMMTAALIMQVRFDPLDAPRYDRPPLTINGNVDCQKCPSTPSAICSGPRPSAKATGSLSAGGSR